MRWEGDYRVSLEKPKQELQGEAWCLEAMWLTNVRIRALAQACSQFDIPIYGLDQKGIYMNESGAKNVGMLALDGADEVPLKENHAASRSRVSLMTSVVSQQADVDALEYGLPLEIMLKGKTAFIVRRLEVPASANVSRPQWHRSCRALSICADAYVRT